MSPNNSDDQEGSLEEACQELLSQWNAFNVAIRDIYSNFDEIHWIKVLSRAFFNYVFHRSGSIRCYRFIKKSGECISIGHVVQMVPVFGCGLVCLVIIAYIHILHDEIIVKRWCNKCDRDENDNDNENDGNCQVNIRNECMSSMIIKVFACYFAFMIVYNYLRTTFTSPGVVSLPEIPKKPSEAKKDASTSSSSRDNSIEWRSYEGRGGCCYIHLTFDREHEQILVDEYTRQTENKCLDDSPPEGTVFIPSHRPTYCRKCKHERPSRSHHCSTCKRCVLQMDHHCMWMNNCIGYNNYRTFIWTIIYLVAGCWYGVAILCVPFYDAIKQNIESHGWRFFYKNNTGFLDLPMPMELLQEVLDSGSLDVKIVIKLVFPFLCFVGMLLTSFLWSHLTYAAQGLTTLERMARERFERVQSLKKNGDENDNALPSIMLVVNPFDQGKCKNLINILGESIWLGLLPLKVTTRQAYPLSGKKKIE